MNSSTAIRNSGDVVAFLKTQHQQIRALFGEVTSRSGPEQEQAFFDLRRLLAVHETAEEEIVHPRAKKEIPDGEAIVDARLKEEHEAKAALSDLEKLETGSPEFMEKFGMLQDSVLAHADAEEQQEFSKLAAELDDETLTSMRTTVERAESMAPTRPHAGVESPAANMLAGPFAAMVDRARDAMSRPK